MYTQEEAYIEGLVKRANEYGFSSQEAITLLKQANDFEDLDANVFNSPVMADHPTLEESPMGLEGQDLYEPSVSPSLLAKLKSMLAGAGGKANELGGRLRAGGGELAERLRNVDPRMAAGVAGGAALLGGGGYMLKKKMDRDRAAQQGY
jgi:hypothetical protein